MKYNCQDLLVYLELFIEKTSINIIIYFVILYLITVFMYLIIVVAYQFLIFHFFKFKKYVSNISKNLKRSQKTCSAYISLSIPSFLIR